MIKVRILQWKGYNTQIRLHINELEKDSYYIESYKELYE